MEGILLRVDCKFKPHLTAMWARVDRHENFLSNENHSFSFNSCCASVSFAAPAPGIRSCFGCGKKAKAPLVEPPTVTTQAPLITSRAPEPTGLVVNAENESSQYKDDFAEEKSGQTSPKDDDNVFAKILQFTGGKSLEDALGGFDNSPPGLAYYAEKERLFNDRTLDYGEIERRGDSGGDM